MEVRTRCGRAWKHEGGVEGVPATDTMPETFARDREWAGTRGWRKPTARGTGMKIDKLLRFAVESGASDVHIQAGAAPMLRIAGEARFVDAPAMASEDVVQCIDTLVPPRLAGDRPAALVRGLDLAHAVEGLARFRCSAYSNLGTPALVLRVIRPGLPSL